MKISRISSYFHPGGQIEPLNVRVMLPLVHLIVGAPWEAGVELDAPPGITGGSVTCPPSGFEAPAELVRKIETPADLPAIDEFN